jgi:hypothetical protein
MSVKRCRSWIRLIALLAVNCLALLALSVAAVAAYSASRATVASAPPRSLTVASARNKQADRALVSSATALRSCQRANGAHSQSCKSDRGAVQRAGAVLSRAERRLAAVARATGRLASDHVASASRILPPRRAPLLAVAGDTLRWARVDGLNSYVLERKVPGQVAQYSLIRGTSVTPPPVPGVVVQYRVRTAAYRSAWAHAQPISYPTPARTATASVATGPSLVTTDAQAAPAITVLGTTLTWDPIANVSTYVLATISPGNATQYSVVSGTSVTPQPIPGVSVRYSVRTAVEGSAWAPEVAISYPLSPPTPPPAEAPASVPSQIQTGLNSGTNPADYEATAMLGAKIVRLGFSIDAPPAQLETPIEKYAAEGVRVLPIAIFDGTIPTSAEAQNLATWAAAYGPGGTFWTGRSDGSFAIQSIEFGNETSYSYQYSDDSPGGYAARAQAYALRFAEAAAAIRSANPGVGLLAQGDAGNAGSIWIENMFKAVPNLGQLVAGWTIHPYGPNWRSRVEALIRETAAQGAPATIPIDITEFGLSTDNGQCVTENYGWQVCMTYQEAGEVLTRTFSELRQVLDGRPGMFLLYQDRDATVPDATDEREDYFGALQYTLQPKGAYTTAVEAMLASS